MRPPSPYLPRENKPVDPGIGLASRMAATEPRRIGVFGGTFDPIHVGHLVAAREALHALDLDRVIFVPAARPWQKEASADAEDRYMMVSFALPYHSSFALSRIELDRAGPTYTADTLEVFRERWPEAGLFFIAGSDAIAKLEGWERFDALAGLAEMVAVSRPGAEPELPDERPGWPRVHRVQIPGIDVSATMVRERVRTGRPIDFLVLPEVARYVRANGLYQS